METLTSRVREGRREPLASRDGDGPEADATAHRLAAIVESSEDAIVGVSIDGLVTSWNAGAERLLGYSAEEICGRPISLTWPEGSLESFREAHHKLMRGERLRPCEGRRVRKDGSAVDVSVTTSPVKDSDGRVVGVASILRDITERREAEAATRLLANVVESSDDAIIAREIDGTVTSWNPGAERLLGYTAAEMVGQPIARVWSPDALPSLKDMQARVASGERVPTFETRAIRKDQRIIDVSVTAVPLRDAEGRVTGVSSIARDITERRAADANARLLASVVESSDDAIIARDLDGTVRSWNPAAERVLGYTAEQMVGRSTTAPIWRANRGRFDKMQSKLAAGKSVPPFEAKAVRGDDTIIDVSVTASPMKDAAGGVTGVAVIFRDITQSKQALRELNAARRRFEGAFHNAPIGMALVDPGGAWLEVNDALCRLMGRSEQEVLATDYQSLTHPEDVEPGLELVRQALAGDIDGFEMEKRYLRPDGSVVWAALGTSLVRDEDGEPLYFVSKVQDITERMEAEEEMLRYSEQLSDLALLDPLTGLRNYRDLHAFVDAELERSRREETEWSVVLFDIDGFRTINAEGGHLEADRVLRDVGAVIEGSCRSTDLAARIGGDKFALVLADTVAEHAGRNAERIVAQVRERAGVSLSYGTASWPADGDAKELVLRGAEMQLRAAKLGAGPAPQGSGSKPVPAAEPGTGGVQRILEVARNQLGMDVAFLAEMTDTSQVYRSLAGDASSFGVEPGGLMPLEDTYCVRMVDGRIPNAVGNTAIVPELVSLPVTHEAGIGSYIGVPIALTDGRLYGSLCAISHDPTRWLAERHVQMMRFLAGLVVHEIEYSERNARERRSDAELAAIQALLSALMARDHYTGEHSKTVVELAIRVARRLGLAEAAVHEVEQVALLHDIGKVGMPDSVLQKRGPLNDQEWDLMRQHPAIGARILASMETLSHLAPAVKAEHERFDGRGYPDGLKGEEIPLPSRICFACDAYHAMTSDRPYRAAFTPEKARAELVAGAGSQFDPKVVGALLAVIDGEPDPRPLGEVVHDSHAQPH